MPGKTTTKFVCNGAPPKPDEFVKIYVTQREYDRESAAARRVLELDPESRWTVVPYRWCTVPTRLLQTERELCSGVAKLDEDATVAVAVMRSAGPSLDRSEPAGALADVRRVAGEVAGGLRMLHRGGVYHLDVKPGNVCVGERARLIDFGLSAPTPREVAQYATGQGTNPNYPPGIGDPKRRAELAEAYREKHPAGTLALLGADERPVSDPAAMSPEDLGAVVDAWGLGYTVCFMLHRAPRLLAELAADDGGAADLRAALRGLLSGDPARARGALRALDPTRDSENDVPDGSPGRDGPLSAGDA